MQKLLTVVVPVYKVERYINKCLDSCVIHKADGSLDDAKMNHLEVIIVNDGTPDSSAELSREYALHYPQTFRQIDQENRGHGGAWNQGLREASGKYLRFLDSDDWLTNLDRLMDELAECDADIVFTDYIRVDEKSGNEDYRSVESLPSKTLPLTKQMIYSQKETMFILNFWHTTYRTAILQPQWPLFEEHVMYDDSILGLAPLMYGRTFIYFKMPLYHYLVGRKGQSMDEQVMARNARCYYRCYARQVDWMNEAMHHELPDEYHTCIREYVQHYACVVFCNLRHLPYREAKDKMKYYYAEGCAYSGAGGIKMMRRYEKMPFLVFYWYERLRIFMRKLLSVVVCLV